MFSRAVCPTYAPETFRKDTLLVMQGAPSHGTLRVLPLQNKEADGDDPNVPDEIKNNLHQLTAEVLQVEKQDCFPSLSSL